VKDRKKQNQNRKRIKQMEKKPKHGYGGTRIRIGQKKTDAETNDSYLD
jgi:hypothetical protein